MELLRTPDITASSQVVWNVVSDIENAASVVSGIRLIEILEPASGPSLTGLKWRETRTWMGQDATEVMWVTEAEDSRHYTTRAENHGAIYVSRIWLEPIGSGTRLSMSFRCEPVTVIARILWVFTGWIAKRSLSGVMEQDLADIRVAAERSASG